MYLFKKNMETSNEFNDWTEVDFENEIKGLRERIRELEAKKVTRVDYEEVVLDDDDDDDIIMIPISKRWSKTENTPVTCLTLIVKHVKMMKMINSGS